MRAFHRSPPWGPFAKVLGWALPKNWRDRTHVSRVGPGTACWHLTTTCGVGNQLQRIMCRFWFWRTFKLKEVFPPALEGSARADVRHTRTELRRLWGNASESLFCQWMMTPNSSRDVSEYMSWHFVFFQIMKRFVGRSPQLWVLSPVFSTGPSKPFDFFRNCWEASLSLWVGNLEEKVLKLRDYYLLGWIKQDLGHVYVQRSVDGVRDYQDKKYNWRMM
jgi:hypothetical protein